MNAYLLIGVPAAGKSTWVANQDWLASHVILSTDKHVDAVARFTNKTYNECFKAEFHEALAVMLDEKDAAIAAKRDIVVDQTNLTRKARGRKMKWFDGYNVIAVVFPIPEDHEKRLDRPGKTIPKGILKHMINTYEEPTLDEGFTEIWYA